MSDSLLPSTSDDIDAPSTSDESSTSEGTQWLPKGKWRQYYTSFVMFVVCISKGFTYGWSSPMIQILEKDDSPVGKMDGEQINILQTLPNFAGILGYILVTVTLIKLGTKASGYVQALVMIGGWVVVLVAETPMMLYAGRFLVGVSQVDSIAAFYLSEVVSDSRRGTLISASMFGISVGALLGYFLGSICGWVVFNTACLVPVVIFLVLMLPVPDTPSYLARSGKINDAIRSSKWFFGKEHDLRNISYEGNRSSRPSLTDIFTVRAYRNALIIFTFIMGFSQLCATTVIPAYSSKIFETARSTISPNQSALMMAVISFCASLAGTYLIDRAGRKFLFIASLVVMAFSQSAVAAYFILEEGNWADVRSKEPLLYVGLGGYIFACTVGVWTVSSTIGAELVPGDVKGTLWMFSGTVSMLVSVATLQAYELITSHFPYYVYFIQAAGFCALTAALSVAIVPETKGLSIGEITENLDFGLPFQGWCGRRSVLDDPMNINSDREPIVDRLTE